MHALQQQEIDPPQISIWQLLSIWSLIGLQSFGGGASTLLLIQRAFTEKKRLLKPADITHYWSLCVFAPGINLIALAILIGKRLGGVRGILVSLIGMLLPSATITCLFAAGFVAIEHLAAVKAAFAGVVPATAGIMLLVGLRFALPQFQVARREGWLSTVLSTALVLVIFLAVAIFHLSVMIVLPAAGLFGLLIFRQLDHDDTAAKKTTEPLFLVEEPVVNGADQKENSSSAIKESMHD